QRAWPGRELERRIARNDDSEHGAGPQDDAPPEGGTSARAAAVAAASVVRPVQLGAAGREQRRPAAADESPAYAHSNLPACCHSFALCSARKTPQQQCQQRQINKLHRLFLIDCRYLTTHTICA